MQPEQGLDHLPAGLRVLPGRRLILPIHWQIER